MDSIRGELIQDLSLDHDRSCHQCIIHECPIDDCEWDDGGGGIRDEPLHRESILDKCYEVGGFQLWKKWRLRLRCGMDIDETDDYPELSVLIDHCLWHHENAVKFGEIIEYCSENNYDIFESKLIRQPFYMDNEKIDILRKYPKYMQDLSGSYSNE